MAKSCPNCDNAHVEVPTHCEFCNYPFAGSEAEKSAFIAKDVLRRGSLEESTRLIKVSQYILLIVGLFYTVFPTVIELVIHGRFPGATFSFY